MSDKRKPTVYPGEYAAPTVWNRLAASEAQRDELQDVVDGLTDNRDAHLTAKLAAAEAKLERLRDDLKTATWQFNEAVSLLRDARSYVDDNTDLAEEIDGSLPVIQSALEHCALAARQALQEQSGE